MCEFLMEEVTGEWEACRIYSDEQTASLVTVLYQLYLEYFVNCIDEV
jgi:hypothetical protein